MSPGSAPRVTLDQVNAAIVGETYTVLPDGRTTICQLTLWNGFTVTGQSACVCKENFNPEIGNPIAKKDAIEKIWPLLGFRLQDFLSRPALSSADAAADTAGTPRPDWADPTPEILRLPAAVSA